MKNQGTGMSFYLQYLKDKIEKPLVYAEAGTGKAGTVLEYIKDTNIEDLELLCPNADIKTDVRNYIFDKLTNENEYWGKNELLEMIDFCNRNQLDLEKKILKQLLSLNYRRI